MSFARLLFATSLMGLAAAATGQQVYRIVGPDGKVTFSDKPPVETNARATAAPTVSLATPGGGSPLPAELRAVAGKFPVTLYTGPNCGPCGAGRAFLSSRGIPFTEKLVSSNEDIEALQRLSNGGAMLPFVTIGGQQLKGYAESEWAQFLDAAGYPKTSQLPPGYRQAAATPLVAAQQTGTTPAGDAAAAAPAPARRRAAPAPAPAPANPAGITF